MRLDQLIEAIAGAVVDAEDIVRRRQIANVLSFFARDGSPSMLHFQLPSAVPRDPESKEPQTNTLAAPILSLIPMTSLSIKDVTIEFQADLSDVTEGPPQAPSAGASPASAATAARTTGTQRDASLAGAEQLSRAGLTFRPSMINVAQPEATPKTSPSTARITLHVEASDPPEGLARLIERLNKLI